MLTDDSFYSSVTEFFASYLDISNECFEKVGILKPWGIKLCAHYLIEKGAFCDANDMKKEYLRYYGGILPNWIFED